MENTPFRMNFMGSVVVVICVIAWLGNGLVCMSVYKNRQLRNPTNLLIVSLAVSDLLMSLCVLPLSAASMFNADDQGMPMWVEGTNGHLCVFQGVILNSMVMSSILTISLTTLARYFCVVRPDFYKRHINNKKTTGIIIISWILVIAGYGAYVLVVKILDKGHFTFFKPMNACTLLFSNDIDNAVINITLNVIGYLLPVCVILWSNMRIYQTVKRHNKQTFKQQKRHKRNTIDIEHPSRDKAENGAVTRQNAPRDEPQCKLGNDEDPTAGRNDHVSKHVTVHVHTQRRGKSRVAVNQVASRTDKHIEEFSNCNSAPCKSKNPVSTLKKSQKLEQLQVEPFPTDISQSPVIVELQMSQGTRKCTKNANEISSEEQILPMKDPEKITMDENHDIKSTVSSSEEESLPMKHPVVVESCKTSNFTWESRGKQAIVMSDQERMVENPNAIEVVQHVTLKDSKNAIRVEKQKSNKPGLSSDAHRLKSSQKEAKVTKLLLMVFVGFCVCWSPIVLTNVTFIAANRKLGYLDLVAAVFACLSTAINPFIYAATNRMFRMTFVEILLMCKR